MIETKAHRHRRYCRRLLRASACIVLLVLWGNVKSALLESTAVLPGGSEPLALAGLVLVVLSLAVGRAFGLDAGGLGLRGPWLRGAAIGLGLGTGVSLAAVVALQVIGPILAGRAIVYAPLAQVSGQYLAWHVAVLMPLSVVVPEEIAFRGALLGLLRATSARVLVSAVAFAAWHLVIAFDTVTHTTLEPGSFLAAIGIAGALLVVGVGGVVFAWLRLRTGTIATSMAAHWSFNAVVLVGLWATR